MTDHSTELTSLEREVYSWQTTVDGFGEEGQRKLKGATVLVSRIGGLGGLVAYELAAAGVGRLILAHAGDLKPPDLNRQLLMTHDALGTSRVECAARRLKELNPRLEVTAIAENINEGNAARITAEADVIVDCAPLFEERFPMNAESVRQRKPLVECAMYELEAHITTFVPGQTGCLRCLYPEAPDYWRRRFPVFGAVSGMVGCLGAMEAIKLIAGLGQPLLNRLLTCDLRAMTFKTVNLRPDPGCPECGDNVKVG
ncbi:MAG: MoeZ/MoeB [Verrucomicrobiales bacterium]|nr:MoeZ/MoeB [Verrucomicrobiales bacterium]|tara:strand:- start:33379 stop:34146 length:768 start_codon:yes stop_codon:yes gene_type:complete